MHQFSSFTPLSHKSAVSPISSSRMKENLYAPTKNYLKEKVIEDNTSSKSTSGNSSPHVKFECEENIDDLTIRPSFEADSLEKINQKQKSSSSFVQEFCDVQPPPPDYEPLEVEEYDVSPSTLWKPKDLEYLNSMMEKELEYMPNPYCLQTMQKNVSCTMRTILYDWMMEVASEFTLKRETFHLGVTYVDRFLSNYQNIKKEEFQLIGMCCLNLAAKIEEVYPPKIEDWARSCDNGYSLESIRYMENFILKILQWKVFPATVFNWLNWLITQWDIFIEYHFGCVNYNRTTDFENLPPEEKKKQNELFEKRFIAFKYPNNQSYLRYREILQILDVAVLDFDIMKYSPRLLAAGLLYLMVSKYFYETNYTLLYYDGPDYVDQQPAGNELDSDEEKRNAFEEYAEAQHFESASVVQELYAGFISAALGIMSIEDIYQTVAFFHPFLEFEVVYELPIVCKILSKEKLESHYEEFLSYQTHNVNSVTFVNQKMKAGRY
ncbi:unnamed protein product [Blepharisma stoltei]|uniref:Cyclin-like domain-containing protein n=1 Tax=Blepharisma stoltei TaxID=1481888 RepID=A0AAU9IU76_9CILI|nr:unnamed protein product [Blepharisma stoltei]